MTLTLRLAMARAGTQLPWLNQSAAVLLAAVAARDMPGAYLIETIVPSDGILP